MLKPIPSEMLRPDFEIPGALRDASGRILIPAGTRLTAALIGRLGRFTATGLYGKEEWFGTRENGTPEATDNMINVAALRPGMRLSESIFDNNDLLLLAAGTEVTHRFLQLLGHRGITRVSLRSEGPRPNDEPAHSAQAATLDDALSSELDRQALLRSKPTADHPKLSWSDARAEALRGLEKHVAASAQLADVCSAVLDGQTTSAELIQRSLQDFADMVTLDANLLPLIVGMQQTKDEYIFDHCVNVALMSMTIAFQLGMTPEQLTEVGLGALLQDVGMLRVPNEIRLASRALDFEEWFEVRRHPYHTLEQLERIRSLPLVVRYVGYQVHERCDTTGYPRGRSGMLIHPYSRIAAIADAFVAMTRPRPHRAPMMPYLAAKTILVEGSINKYDRMLVRGFLDCVSMFPIGSLVELDDGTRGKVVRATPGLQTRPMVQELDADGTETSYVIDLAEDTDRSVVRALPGPTETAAAVGAS